MSKKAARFGVERILPMPHPGPDPRLTESLVNPVASILVSHGYPPASVLDDWAARETADRAVLHQPEESK